jgi:nitrogenase-stabilizing/protective protein
MDDFLTTLGRLSSAEEFLDFLGVSVAPEVLVVHRLHILKRFHDYLARAPMPDGGEAAVKAAYATALAQACRDFSTSTAAVEKVFPVFHRSAQACCATPGAMPCCRPSAAARPS